MASLNSYVTEGLSLFSNSDFQVMFLLRKPIARIDITTQKTQQNGKHNSEVP